MDTDGLSLLDGSSLGQRLALYFADSRQGYFQSFTFQQVYSVFGTIPITLGTKLRNCSFPAGLLLWGLLVHVPTPLCSFSLKFSLCLDV